MKEFFLEEKNHISIHKKNKHLFGVFVSFWSLKINTI